MVNRYTVFDMFVLERWLDGMASRLERSGVINDSATVRDVYDEMRRAVYELREQRKPSEPV